MGDLLLSICVTTSMYNGLYVEPDSGKLYSLSNEQHIVGIERKSYESSYKRPNIQNKNMFLKEFYEKK